jgi:hypothetical protein
MRLVADMMYISANYDQIVQLPSRGRGHRRLKDKWRSSSTRSTLRPRPSVRKTITADAYAAAYEPPPPPRVACRDPARPPALGRPRPIRCHQRRRSRGLAHVPGPTGGSPGPRPRPPPLQFCCSASDPRRRDGHIVGSAAAGWCRLDPAGGQACSEWLSRPTAANVDKLALMVRDRMRR